MYRNQKSKMSYFLRVVSSIMALNLSVMCPNKNAKTVYGLRMNRAANPSQGMPVGIFVGHVGAGN